MRGKVWECGFVNFVSGFNPLPIASLYRTRIALGLIRIESVRLQNSYAEQLCEHHRLRRINSRATQAFRAHVHPIH